MTINLGIIASGVVSTAYDPNFPLSLPSLVLWLDGADTATITATSGNVDTWADKSGVNNNANDASTGNRITTGTHAINGKNVLRKPTGFRYLLLPNFLSGATAVTALWAGQNDTNGANGPLLDQFGTRSDSLDDEFPFSDDKIYFGFASTTRKTAGDPTPSFANPYSFTCISAANSWALRMNGTAFFSTVTNIVGIGTAPKLLGTGSGTTPEAVVLGEVIVCNAALGSSDYQAAEAYLAAKWAIS